MKNNSKSNKPSRFSFFKDKHFVLIAVVVLAVAGIGTYYLNSSSAATVGCASTNTVIFYLDATTNGCAGKIGHTVASTGPYFKNFSEIKYTKSTGVQTSYLDKVSAVDNKTSRWVCLYNNSKLIKTIAPYKNITYVGDTANDKADYYRMATNGCPAS
jgi:hypothetical protein